MHYVSLPYDYLARPETETRKITYRRHLQKRLGILKKAENTIRITVRFSY